MRKILWKKKCENKSQTCYLAPSCDIELRQVQCYYKFLCSHSFFTARVDALTPLNYGWFKRHRGPVYKPTLIMSNSAPFLTFKSGLISEGIAEGQIMSECIHKIIDFPNYHQINLIDFCPGSFLVVIWKIDDFRNTFWNYFTFNFVQRSKK